MAQWIKLLWYNSFLNRQQLHTFVVRKKWSCSPTLVLLSYNRLAAGRQNTGKNIKSFLSALQCSYSVIIIVQCILVNFIR